jgi:NADH:ubiquinone reductase (H+-translocating)
MSIRCDIEDRRRRRYVARAYSVGAGMSEGRAMNDRAINDTGQTGPTSVAPAAGGKDPHRIVIVGGGAGGLELASKLGRRLGKRRKAWITLLDRGRTHLWKPLLHEVAAGTMDRNAEAVAYMAQARWHHFRFRLGAMTGLDRAARRIFVAPTVDEDGNEVTPRHSIEYDTLIIAVGSVANYFNTPGAAEHAIALDTEEQAARFHRRMVNACLRANAQTEPLRPGQLHCVIVGAGATGVELAAELHKSMRELAAFGLDRIDFDKSIRLTIVEAGPRILPALPERLSEAARELLVGLGVVVRTATRVDAITAEGVHLADGEFLAAELVVWAAGIKAPDFLAGLDGLESDRINRLVVRPTLQTTRDDAIFACGDCASCTVPGATAPVPPRAQAAHQQATLLARAMRARIAGRPVPSFVYRDFGSLVSFGEYSAIGSLMGALVGGSLRVEGLFARLMYRSLYKLHRLALEGVWTVAFETAANLITRRIEPRIKLH